MVDSEISGDDDPDTGHYQLTRAEKADLFDAVFGHGRVVPLCRLKGVGVSEERFAVTALEQVPGWHPIALQRRDVPVDLGGGPPG